ncbi:MULTISPECIES: hypothetical protein [unclassified Pseudomonas]|uniref:hypothetical protein n=1 Tax=unclassified Pseudomonas TaxID=196821 RepID=UPI0030DCEBE6
MRGTSGLISVSTRAIYAITSPMLAWMVEEKYIEPHVAEQNNLSVQDLLRTSNDLNQLAIGLKQEVRWFRL